MGGSRHEGAEDSRGEGPAREHRRLRGARDEIADGVKLIDVREHHEWDESHIEGATLVPELTVAERIDEVAPGHLRAPDPPLPHRQPLRAGRGRSCATSATRTSPTSRAASSPGRRPGLRSSTTPGLTPDQRERYSRHTLLPEVGVEGQLKLLNAKVLLLGAGGLGSPTALYLAAAGIGTIGLVDDDVVDESNLQRQVIHTTDRVGDAEDRLGEGGDRGAEPRRRRSIEHSTRLDASNILELIERYDVLVDGADNFPTRYLLNDASVRLRKPVVSASILGFDGQISTFVPYEGPATAASTRRRRRPSSRPAARRTASSA